MDCFFQIIMIENLANRHESSRISVNSYPIRAAFGVFLTISWSIPYLIAIFSNSLLHIVVNSAQYRGDSGRIQPNPANIRNCSYLFCNWIVEHHEWVEKFTILHES